MNPQENISACAASRTFSRLAILLLTTELALTACGGGGGGPTPPVASSPAPAPSPDQNPAPAPSPVPAPPTPAPAASPTPPSPPPAPAEFEPAPSTLPGDFVWVRNFGANPSLPTSGTRVDVYSERVLLTQYFFGNSFSIESTTLPLIGNLFIGPGVYDGQVYRPSTRPRQMTTGLVRQARSKATPNNAGWLDLPFCGATNGAFVVHEVAYDENGALTKLAADFSAVCSYGYQPNATGAIRYGSTYPSSLAQTFVVAGLDHTVTEGDPMVLDGTLSWNPSSRITSLTWAQLSGPPIDLSDCTAGICRTYAPLVEKGGAIAAFLLTATSEAGQSATQELRVTIRSWKDRQSRVDVFGNGYVSGGSNIRFTPDDGVFEVPAKRGTESVYPSQTPERVELAFFGNATYGPAPIIEPNFILSNSAGAALTPGSYAGSLRAGFAPGSQPGLEFSIDGRGCSWPDWRASVAAMDRDSLDLTLVSRAAVFIDVICAEGGGPESSYARFWIDYEPQNPPLAIASGPTQALSNAPFVLRDAGSQTPAGSLLTRYWRQVHGTPARSLSIANDGSLLVDPDPSTPIGSELVFAYSLVDSLGQGAVDLVHVTIGSEKSAASAPEMAARVTGRTDSEIGRMAGDRRLEAFSLRTR